MSSQGRSRRHPLVGVTLIISTREPGYCRSQARSARTYCRVPLGGTAKRLRVSGVSHNQPTGNSPLASHQQGTCLPPASPPAQPGTFTAQASESTCPQCPPGELGWDSPSAADGGPVPQRSSTKMLQRYRASRTAAVPSIHARASLYLSACPCIQCRATRALAPSRGRDQAPAPSLGEKQGSGLSPGSLPPRSGRSASLRR